MNNDHLEKLRGIYFNQGLDEAEIKPEPFGLFNKWLDEAVKSEYVEANAFVLSTVTNGKPRSRIVLLKGVEDGEFVFYTNYESAKGNEIIHDQYVAMNFWWGPLGRQVRIEGTVKKVSEEASDIYFSKRPRGSQIGAIASAQSKVTTREQLEESFMKITAKYENSEVIPRPKNWGGYAIEPSYIEFWQGRANRLHDRIAYERTNNGWEIRRLAP